MNFTHKTLDPQLIPDVEADLASLSVPDTGVTLTFTDAAKFRASQALPATPLVLMVYSDQTFYEGQYSPDASVNAPRAAGQWHAIAVRGRAGWYFKTASGVTATLKGKLLGAL